MSASLNPQDKDWLKVCPKGTIDPMEATMIDMAFDLQTDQDIEIIKRDMDSIKKIKRMCIVKLFTFLPEALFSNIFQSKEINQTRRQLNRLYFKFLFNKINYENFKKELRSISKNGTIVFN